jgi:hypothetical protein
MKPIDFPESNCMIGGEIPANKDEEHGMILSRWQGNWRERITFLLTGKVWLLVKGDYMPPHLLSGDHTFMIENP